MSSVSKLSREVKAFWTPCRRRNLVIGCTALALGGYGTYCIYTSAYVCRKRRQIQRLMNTLSNVAEAAEKGSGCTKLICADLHIFLSSEMDEMPQSLRQLLKLGRSEEVRETLVTMTAAFSQGIMASGLQYGSRLKEVSSTAPNKGSGESCAKNEFDLFRKSEGGIGETVSRLRIRESHVSDSRKSSQPFRLVSLDKGKQIVGKEIGDLGELELFRDSAGQLDWSDEVVENWGKGSRLHSSRKNSRSGGERHEEGLPERILGKLFSPAGTGFASAVVGSATRNFILSVLECNQKARTRSKQHHLAPMCRYDVSPGSTSDGEEAEEDDTWTPIVNNILDFACSSRGRPLIAECIEIFVATAVTAFLEKTKDVNVYEELVAGITKPRHREPVKDILTSVCSSAVQTLVRTSHEVLSVGSSGPSESDQSPVDSDREVVEESFLLDNSHVNRRLDGYRTFLHELPRTRRLEISDQSSSSIHVQSTSVSRKSGAQRYNSLESTDSESQHRLERKEAHGRAHGWVDGLSRTLAIPSNRKLVVEVAGTMSAEAVKSSFEALVGICCNVFKISGVECGSMADAAGEQTLFSGLGNRLFMLERHATRVAKVAAARSLIVMTICLAICLHFAVSVSR